MNYINHIFSFLRIFGNKISDNIKVDLNNSRKKFYRVIIKLHSTKPEKSSGIVNCKYFKFNNRKFLIPTTYYL